MRSLTVSVIAFLMVTGLSLLAFPPLAQTVIAAGPGPFVTILIHENSGVLCFRDFHPGPMENPIADPKEEAEAGLGGAGLLEGFSFRGIMPETLAGQRGIIRCTENM